MHKLILLCLLAIFDLSAMHSGDKRKTETTGQTNTPGLSAGRQAKKAKSYTADQSSDSDSDTKSELKMQPYVNPRIPAIAQQENISIDAIRKMPKKIQAIIAQYLISVVASQELPFAIGALSADGAQVATIADTNKVQIWDVARKTKIHEFIHPVIDNQKLVSVALSPDNSYCAALSNSFRISLWDIKSKKLLADTSCLSQDWNDEQCWLRFSPNSKQLLVVIYRASTPRFFIFSAPFKNGEKAVFDSEGVTHCPIFSANGKFFAVPKDIRNKNLDDDDHTDENQSELSFFNADTNTPFLLQKHNAWDLGVAISANGEYIATIPRRSEIEIARNQQFELYDRIRNDSMTHGVLLHDIEKLIIEYTDPAFKLFCTHTIMNHYNSFLPIEHIIISPDNKYIAIAPLGTDWPESDPEFTEAFSNGYTSENQYLSDNEYSGIRRNEECLHVISLATGKIVFIKKWGNYLRISNLCFSADSKFLCVNKTYIYHVATGALIKKITNTLLTSADGMHLAEVTDNSTNILTIQEDAATAIFN